VIFTLSELWNKAKSMAMSLLPDHSENAVVDGIMMWIGVAIMLVVFLPVIAAILAATPAIASTSPLNATQISTTSMVGSSYGLLIVVLIILAAVILLGVIAYLRQR
jgi:hypothetical protein